MDRRVYGRPVIGNGRWVDSVDVGVAVIQAPDIFKVDRHAEEAVCAVESDRTGPTVTKTCLCPGEEHIAGREHRLGRDDSLHNICAIETYLPIDRPVAALERGIPALGATVIFGWGGTFDCDGKRHWWDINDTDHRV
jgi:hypothetical protein